MGIITIIGSGLMGSAMSYPARDNGHQVRLVGTMLDREIIDRAKNDGWHLTLKRKLPEGNQYYHLEELGKALEGTDLVISGVSSFGVDWFLDDILPTIPDNIPILSITKGMLNQEDGSLLTFPDLYYKHYPNKIFLAVGGPCTSYELADHDPTEVCYCGYDIEALQFTKEMLQTDYYFISLSTDVVGVECAVAMKNAYALGVSLAIGLSNQLSDTIHYNSQAALFGQSIREMRKMIALAGGKDENIAYGAGDLYVTVFGGRSRKIGTLLGEGKSFDEAQKMLSNLTLESVVIAQRSCQAILVLIQKGIAKKEDFPLLLHMGELLLEGKKVNIPWEAFTVETFY